MMISEEEFVSLYEDDVVISADMYMSPIYAAGVIKHYVERFPEDEGMFIADNPRGKQVRFTFFADMMEMAPVNDLRVRVGHREYGPEISRIDVELPNQNGNPEDGYTMDASVYIPDFGKGPFRDHFVEWLWEAIHPEEEL